MRTLLVCCFFSLIAFADEFEKGFPPARYIGLYNEYLGFKNGNLPNNSISNYTGEWRIRKGNNSFSCIDGYYKAGKPIGVWKEYYESGILAMQYSYDESRYFCNLYYPDGNSQIFSEGTIEYKNNELIHSPSTIICAWDFYGDKLSEGSITSSQAGWQWTDVDMIFPLRFAEIEKVKCSIYGFRKNSNICYLAVFFYTTETFLGKAIFEAQLNHSTGMLTIYKKNFSGNLENLQLEVKTKITKTTETKQETGFEIKIAKENILSSTTFLPFTIEKK